MKYLLRNILFSYLVLVVVSYYFNSVAFNGDQTKAIFLVALALGLIMALTKPILKVISLPTSGILGIVFSFLITVASFFVLAKFLPFFKITEGSFTGLRIFGFVVDSYQLTEFWSYVAISVAFTIIVVFFHWLCTGKKKK